MLNNGFCPTWFTADKNDEKCGRLPFIFNVNAANYAQYNTLRKMQGLRLPSIVHFVSDGKPWVVLLYEYVENGGRLITGNSRMELAKQGMLHIAWRKAYFEATNEKNPRYKVLLDVMQGTEEEEIKKEKVTKEKKAKDVGYKKKNVGKKKRVRGQKEKAGMHHKKKNNKKRKNEEL